MLAHKTSLNKFKKIKIISNIFSDHNDMRLKSNYKKKNLQKHKLIKSKQHASNNWWVTLNNQRRNEKNIIGTSENENTVFQNLWETAKEVIRETFIAVQVYLRRKEKSQINNLTLYLKELEKEEQTKPKLSRKKK